MLEKFLMEYVFSMASICDKEMGTVYLELPKTIPSNDIEFVSKLPSRRIFYNFRQGERKEIKVFTNNELSANNPMTGKRS